MGKFVIFSGGKGLRFHLRSANGETIATSEVYTTMASCRSGIESVRRSSGKAKLEDLVRHPEKKVTNPKFQVFVDKAGAFRFRLRARNGEISACSQGYSTLDACMSGIDSVRNNAPDALIENCSAGG